MCMKSIDKNHNSIRRDNKGAALIVCIVVLLFVSILATIILYMAGINYRMKKSDYNNKCTFYESEMPLETMQTNLVVPVSEALNNSYVKFNTCYIFNSTGEFNKQRAFYDLFRDEMADLLLKKYSGSDVGDATGANNVIVKNILHNLTGVELDHIYVDTTGAYDGDTLGYINALGSIDATQRSSGNPPVYFKNDSAADAYGHSIDTYIVVSTADITGMTSEAIVKDFLQVLYFQADGVTPADLNDRCIYFDNIGVVTVRDGYRSIITTNVAVHFPSLDVRYASDPINPHVNEYTSYDVYQLINYYDWRKN